QHIVAKELKNIAVEVVASALGDDVHIRSGVSAKRCVVHSGLNLELLNRVRIWNRNAAAEKSARLKIIYLNVVHLKIIVSRESAVRAKRTLGFAAGPSSKFARVCHARRNAWRKGNDLGEISGDQRQIADESAIGDAAERGSFGLKRL